MSENKKSGVFKEIIQPALVLCAIALVVTGCLVVTNYFTADLIAANSQGAAGEARKALLPEADKFTMLEVGEDLTANNGVVDIYDAENGAGTIVTVTYQGYNAPCVVMVAFAPDGTIVGYTPLEQEETPALATRYLNRPIRTSTSAKPARVLPLLKRAPAPKTKLLPQQAQPNRPSSLPAVLKMPVRHLKQLRGCCKWQQKIKAYRFCLTA